MSEERLAILKMLEEGKVTAEEAEKLLRAVEEGAGKEGKERDFFATFGEGMGRAFKAVQEIKVDEVVGKAMESAGEAVDSVKRSEVGRLVDEVVNEVAEAVSDVTGAGAGKAEVVKEQDWKLEGAGAVRIRAETSNGGIELKGTEGDQIEVRTIVKVRARDEAAAREFASQVEVGAEQEGDEIRVWREYPGPPRGVRVEVRYEIQCPSRLGLHLYTLNGKIQIQGAGAGVEAATSNGDVELQGGRGWVHARTKNGKVRAVVDALEGEGAFNALNGKVEVEIIAGQAPVQAKTLNGSIELKLPADFDGQLDARTTNGRVQSDFPIPVTGQVKKNQLEGPIGRGGESAVRLRTLNGSIALKLSGG